MKALFKTRTLIRALALAGALAAPALANAQAACNRWDISQGWWAIQGDFAVAFDLVQKKTAISGRGYVKRPHMAAPLIYELAAFRDYAPLKGEVTGTVIGNFIEMQTPWGGVYIGTIDATGRIDGTTYDQHNSMSSARWYSDRRMPCLARGDQATGEQAGAEAKRPAPSPLPVPTGSSTLLKGSSGSAGASALAGLRPTGAMQPLEVPTQVPTVLTSLGGAKSAWALPGGLSRPAPTPIPVAAPAPAPAPPTVSPPASKQSKSCKKPYVRRHANAADKVCVTRASHHRVVVENKRAAKRVRRGGGAWGPDTCRTGYVWREAYVGDVVCVKPEVRAFVRQENQLAAARAHQ